MPRRSLHSTLPAALLVAAATAAASSAGADAHPRESANVLARHFGYLIGERFVQRVQIAAPASHTLDRASLPKAGRANRLLELRALEVRESETGGERRYELQLHYQVMANDDMIGVSALPRPTLQFTHGAQRARLHLSEQHISVSPLTDTDAWDHAGLQTLRPEHGTPLMNTLATRQRIAGYALALAGLALYWLYRVYGLPFLARSRGPFHRAWRALRSRHGADADSVQSGLRSLHRAFDQTYGASMLRPQIGAFLEHHPRYAALREPIERFFEFSRRQFYAAHTSGEAQLTEIRELAHRLSLLERRLQ